MNQRSQDTENNRLPHDPATFARNMATVAEQCQRILQEFISRQSMEPGGSSLDPFNLCGAFTEFFTQLVSDPGKLMQKQFDLWQDYMQLWMKTTQRLLGEQEEPIITPDTRDKRFKDKAWQDSTVFDFIKQSYLLTARWMQNTAHDVSGLDPHTAKKIDFYTRQFVDALSPSNFVITNPEVLRTTIESNGANLVHGLQNMLEDLERGNGQLRISMTDMTAFEFGKNIAVTPGKVVYQNDLMQLIQYSPTTEKVYKTPVLAIPAWINKYYIMDLQAENSLVRWMVDQGFTVFVISWVNPDEKLSQKRFDDYMLEGPLAAIDVISEITGEKSISIMAYCLGGTLTAATLAHMHSKGTQDRVKSVTYLTTMTDFTEAGELSVFIDEEQLSSLEERMSETGYLDGSEMATTFSMLRANDLIWSFVVNNYLLGKDPFPFDLLYWNADSTRMPAVMHSFYLRNMYQKNLLVKPGGVTLCGTPIDLRKIKTPSYILSTREDHIAPWKSTYAATQIYQGPIRFVLAASGHIAGVVNPPAKKKYSHWINEKLAATPDKWFENASEEAGSWWPDWKAWQEKIAGDEKVAARKPGSTKYKPIEDAPGSYVKVKT
jgi:polyhydroxyalkanoate synthase